MSAALEAQLSEQRQPALVSIFGRAAISAAPEGFILEDSMQSPVSYRARLRNANGDYVHVLVILDHPQQERIAP